MMQNKTIAVFGATGHTGRFVVNELRRRGLRAILVGRDAGKLASAAGGSNDLARLARVDDAASLDGALAGADAVINCAGPFLDTALPVIDAALRAGIPYLDVTAEQVTVQTIIAERDDAARRAGIVLLPAAAFYGGLADLLASAAAASFERVDEIAVAVALDSWHPTEGTRVTGARNVARRLVQRNGRLVPVEVPALQGNWTFPAPFGRQEMVMQPFSETITLANHIRAETILSWINRAPLHDLDDPKTPQPVPSDDSGRSSQQFAMDVLVRSDARHRRATATGRDIYAVSAPIIVEAAQRLLAGKASGMAGVRSLAEIFDPRDFLEALGPDVVQVQFAEAAGPLLDVGPGHA
ncbi:MAG TPA: saccharopine dehydrogenase NADP-binding domain-containing protein [Aliidongia sp.]|uniref:saccharopine dehydrogenase family protein n=1 Tax=Aliidongia sp. TaxID=1914230 RepID=UPI002DDC91AC|nr:saccharopine dehydrogenase NADP-binding domain-containing protein [Aliidongia sp.]HEV2672937.1 saccharopine dehydrogenase NADP-binding domain-containing protein [Aliidongia sp.]